MWAAMADVDNERSDVESDPSCAVILGDRE